MANVQKYARSACGHLCAHFERAKDENGEYVKFGNKKIDPSRTHLNYNLAPERSEGQIEFMHSRISEVRCLNREDVKVMCSWCVTAPQGVMEDEQEQFFKSTYDFLSERYGGEQNVISAYVHNDESTPHLHFAFIPVVYDKKKDCFKVSAKEVLTKRELLTIHTDLSSHLESVFGRDVGVLLDDTTKRDKDNEYTSMAELKRQTAIKELEALKTPVATLNEVRGINDKAEVKKPLFAKNESVVLSREDYDRLYKQAEHAAAADLKVEELQGQVNFLKRENSRINKRIAELAREAVKLKEQIKALMRQVNLLTPLRACIETLKDIILDRPSPRQLERMNEALDRQYKAEQEAMYGKVNSRGRER